MKIIGFLHNDFSIKNNLKLRRIKLSICSALLIFSFTIIGYKTFSLASIAKVDKNQIFNKNLSFRAVLGLIFLIFAMLTHVLPCGEPRGQP